MINNIGSFLFNNLEYVVAVCGGIGAFVYIKTKKLRNYSDDVTPYLIKIKKQQERINTQSKSIL